MGEDRFLCSRCRVISSGFVGHCEHVKAAIQDAKIEGVTLYAWWKDGVQYVGTSGRTLKVAIEDIRGV